MSIKSLFNNKTTTVQSANSASTDVESKDFVLTRTQRDETFLPFIDFSSASNFAKFGSAEEYYKNSIERIYNEYPYDGSEKEKLIFELSSSYLDKYIFDEKYPKTNGYINFTGPAGGGTKTSGYGSNSAPQYIYVRGGIHVADGMSNAPLYKTFDKSIVYNDNKKRVSSLKMDIPNGITTEFWLKKTAFNNSKTEKEVILDLWNGNISSSANYGRFTLALSGTATGTDTFIVTMQSGTTGFFEQPIGTATVTTSSLSNWHHYSFSFISASSGITSRIYVDGDLNESKSLGSTGINEIGGLVNGYIGALQTAPSGNIYHGVNLVAGGTLSASLDDFRFWKTRRTSKQIYNNWYQHVGGGTNTDDANINLGVYYKFNEGIVGNDSIDSVVLDYSGRLVNGAWTGYASGMRSTSSAFTESGLLTSEPKDPIIYSSHSEVSSLKTSLMKSGKIHDNQNPALLYYKVPQWIRDEDSSTGDSTKQLYQIIASYFDTLHAQITALPYLKNKVYPSSSYKALPFADKLLEDKGLVVSNLFADSNVLEAFGDRDLNKVQFEKKITDIKNQIYTNIYNNLESIYKHKGTEGSIRNMLRCFGIDDEIVKLNIYTDEGKHYFSDAFKHTNLNKKYVNFNKQDNLNGSIYQTSSVNHSLTYTSGSGAEKLEQYNAFSSEVSIIVPKKVEFPKTGFFSTPFQSASVFGMHGAATDSADYTWGVSETTTTPQTASIQFTMRSTGSLDHQAVLQLTGGSDNALVVYADPNQALTTNPSTIDHIIYTGSNGLALCSNLSGDGQVLAQNTSYNLNTTNEFSISFYLNNQIGDINSNSFIDLRLGGSDSKFKINLINNPDGDFSVDVVDTNSNTDTATFSGVNSQSDADTWVHYVAVFDTDQISSSAGEIKLYKNSSEIASSGFNAASFDSAPVQIDRLVVMMDDGLALQDLILWNKKLSQTDINNLYANGQWINPTSVSSSAIHDWYKMGYDQYFRDANYTSGSVITSQLSSPYFISSSVSTRSLSVTTGDNSILSFTDGKNPFGAARTDTQIRNELTAALNTVFSANFGNTTYSGGDGNLATFTLKSGSAGPETVNGSVVSASFAISATNNGATLSSTTHDDLANFQVYLVRDKLESPSGKFLLKNYAGNITLESPVYKEVYSNEPWNISVRVKPEDYPIAGNVVTSSNRDYVLEFYGVNHAFDTVKNEFFLTQSLNYDTGSAYLSNAKRFYVGAHRTNFTGSVLEKTDIKAGRFNLWYDYVGNDEVKLHNRDVSSKGNKRTARPSTIFGKNLEQVEIPSYELLAADWDFETVTTSDSSGEFIVIDASSGSTDIRYGWIDNITRREHRAKAIGFPVSSTNVISNEIVYSSKKELPEISYSADGVTIKGNQQEFFIEDEDVSDNFFALEKSMYQVISEEMMRTLTTAQEMSNLMGEAVERYRLEYKKLNHVRRMFFEDVEEDPDFDKFTEYFKWIDSSVSYMVSQMFPMSVRFSKGISDVVESHLFERNKYQNKLPLLTTHTATEGSAQGVGLSKYRWEFGHAPVEAGAGDNDNCLWRKTREQRTDISERETIKDVINNRNNAQATKLAKSDRTVYDGSTFAIRRFSKPVDMNANISQTLHPGINYNLQKNRDYIWSATHRGSELTSLGIPKNVLIVGAGEGQGIELQSNTCNDVEVPNEKKKFNTTVFVGKFAGGGQGGTFTEINDSASYNYAIKGAHNLPFDIFSGSIGAYNSAFSSGYRSDAYVTNIHSDTTDFSNDIPLQGPFTKQWVGGHQSRHIELNRFDLTLRDDDTGTAPPNNLDNRYTRPEGWLLKVVESVGTGSDGAFGIVDPQYGVTKATNIYPDAAKKGATLYRDGRAKRPFNISNIQTTTSSANHGNYKEKYEVISAMGKHENNLFFRKNSDTHTFIPTSISDALPKTTNPITLIGQQPSSVGNAFGQQVNNRQPDGQIVVPSIAGAFASGSFTVTGAYVAGTTSTNATFRVYSTGSQIKNNEGINITSAGAGLNFYLQTGTVPADSSPNFYVATGSGNDLWTNLRAKINNNMPTEIVAGFTEVTPGNTDSIALRSGSLNPQGSIFTGSLGNLYGANNFSFSGWIDISGSDAVGGDQVIFQFASASGEVGRQLFINTAGELQYDHTSTGNFAPASARCTRIQTISNFVNDYKRAGLIHVTVTEDYGGGPGSVTFYINGSAVSSTQSQTEVAGGCSQPLTPLTLDGSGSLFNSNLGDKPFPCSGSNFVFWSTNLQPFHVDYIYNKGKYFHYTNALYCDLTIKSNLIQWFPLAKASSAGNDSISGSHFTVENSKGYFSTEMNGPAGQPYAQFEIVNATTGTLSNITLSISAPPGVEQCGTIFNLSNGTGGTEYKGVFPGNSIVLDKTFVLDSSAVSPAIAVTPGGTNSQFWNTLSQSIKDNTVYDNITIDSTAGHQAVFHLTASQTGSIHNKTITTSGGNSNLTFPGSQVGFAGGITHVSASFAKDIIINRITSSVTRTVISSRFSAPGSIDTMTYGYLDAYSQEYSVYNDLNYRNLSVRGIAVRVSASSDGSDFYNFGGSGESGTIRVNDHRNNRDGLKSLLSRHSGKFGIDARYASELGSNPLSQPNPDPSFHKLQRNGNKRPSDASTIAVPVLVTRHDNMYISSPIPRSDFQYKWVTSSLGDNYSITSGKQRMYGYAHPTGILSSSVTINGDSGFVPAITFPTASEIFGE